MQVFFSSRDAARKATFGKLVDNGPDAPKGKRFARDISGIGGNSKQRKQAVKKIIREHEEMEELEAA